MDIVEFNVKHLAMIEPQPAQAAELAAMSDGYRVTLDTIGVGVTVLHNGKVLACGGFLHYFAHRAEMWSFLSVDAGPHMLTLTRIGKRMLEGCTYKRVEATVVSDFMEGHRWLQLLGFQLEHPGLPYVGPNQETMALYSRIKI